MRLNFKNICANGSCDKSRLKRVEHDLTLEDCEYYDKIGWKWFVPENHTQYLLPSLGEECWINKSDVVLEIKGRRYKVHFDFDCNKEEWSIEGKSLILEETNEPLTQFENNSNSRRSYWYKFFGQPAWIQNEYYPLDSLGNPCYHFCTIENGWGDSGNYNILLGFDKNGIPNEAYFEASCC